MRFKWDNICKQLEKCLAHRSSGSNRAPLPGQVPYESSETEVEDKTRGRTGWVWVLLLIACLGVLAGFHTIHPLQLWCASSAPPAHPLLGGTPWAGPWWLAASGPVRYQEQRGGENSCFLSTPCPGLTGGSAVVIIHWYINGLRPGRKCWKFWVKTSIYPTHIRSAQQSWVMLQFWCWYSGCHCSQPFLQLPTFS